MIKTETGGIAYLIKNELFLTIVEASVKILKMFLSSFYYLNSNLLH